MSYRNDTNLPYDLSILSSVPENLTLEEKQDRHALPPLSPNRLPTGQQQGQLESVAEHAVAKGPWYRTRWGIAAIVIVIVLIIGAAVGGAVGGTHHSSPKQSKDVGGNPEPNSGDGSNNTSQSSSTSTSGPIGATTDSPTSTPAVGLPPTGPLTGT